MALLKHNRGSWNTPRPELQHNSNSTFGVGLQSDGLSDLERRPTSRSNMSRLFTVAFWQMVGWALARTALAAIVPAIPILLADPAGSWYSTLLKVALIVAIAAAIMLAGLPAVDSGPWWQVALQRAVRQFGQYVGGAAVGGVLLTDLDWQAILTAAGASALSTFILAALTLVPSLEAAVVVDGQVVTGGLPATAESAVPAEADEPADDSQDETTEGTDGLPDDTELETVQEE